MLTEHATRPDGRRSPPRPVYWKCRNGWRRAGSGAAEHLTDFFEEFRMYHRKDGQIVKDRTTFYKPSAWP